MAVKIALDAMAEHWFITFMFLYSMESIAEKLGGWNRKK